jgi:hypothetical protein
VLGLGRTDSANYMVMMPDRCTTTLTEKRLLRSPNDPKLKDKLFAFGMSLEREGDSPIVFEAEDLRTAAGPYFLDGDDDSFADLWIPKNKFISALRDSLARGASREPTDLLDEVDTKVAALLDAG